MESRVDRLTGGILDYGLSFISGRAEANQVRFWIESRTCIFDSVTDRSDRFYQCASCKSEHTFAERDLFVEANYDFMPIFGQDHGIVFRRKSARHDGYRETRPAHEWWGGQMYRLVAAADVQEVTTFEEIAAATHQAKPLVAVTEIRDEKSGLTATIENPVKTMNIHEPDRICQVDTGPVAWPDLSERRERLADVLSLAFVAFNAPHFADFVIEAPTTVGEGEAAIEVYHYSKLNSLPATNRLFAIGPGFGNTR